VLAHLTTCDEIDSFRLQLFPETALLCGYASCVSQCGRCSAARKMFGAPSFTWLINVSAPQSVNQITAPITLCIGETKYEIFHNTENCM